MCVERSRQVILRRERKQQHARGMDIEERDVWWGAAGKTSQWGVERIDGLSAWLRMEDVVWVKCLSEAHYSL